MAKTRATKSSTKSTSDENTEATKSSTQKRQLAPESSNPPKIFILPQNTAPDARMITLENPRYQTDSRYLVCPQRGIYEFTKIAAPKSTPRSWLLSAHNEDKEQEVKKDTGGDGEDDALAKGYVLKSADMLLATPYDALFLTLPSLWPKTTKTSSEPAKQLFLSSEDYFDRMIEISPHLRSLLKTPSIRELFELKMAAVSDTVDAGDEIMYRVKPAKLLEILWMKAQKMVEKGLPESMEERFIRKALEVPILCLKRDESFHDELRKAEEEADKGTSTPTMELADSQESISTTTSISTAATSFISETSHAEPTPKPQQKPTISAPEGVPHLLRLKTSFNFILSSYIPLHLHTPLTTLLLTTTSLADFTPLTTHQTHLSNLRKEAIAARSLNEVSGNKRRMEDELEDEDRAEKKRKKEEEEKRKKAGESRGVKNLKKVNVTGMKKMSDFFKKKA